MPDHRFPLLLEFESDSLHFNFSIVAYFRLSVEGSAMNLV